MELIGECKGNNGNGCFMDSSGHNCGCFTIKERSYSEEEVFELLLKHQSDYRSAVRNTSPLNWSFDINKWFEKSKKK